MLLLTLSAYAEGEESQPKAVWNLSRYVAEVLEVHPNVETARHAVEGAHARISSAKVFPNPELSVGLTQLDATHAGNPTMVGVELSVPIELGGKRSGRVGVARAEVNAADAEFDEVRRALRATAAEAFINLLHARLRVARRTEVLEGLQRLVAADERRLAAGEIGEVVLLQLRVEAEQFRAELIEAEGQQVVAEVSLRQLLGARVLETRASLEIVGDLRTQPPTLDTASLFALLSQRADLRSVTARVEVAERRVKLEEANRVIDIAAKIGWQHSFSVSSAPTVPSAEILSASLSIPLPFSHIYRGDIEAAKSAHRQAVSGQAAAQLAAEGELQQALARFEAASRKAALFERGVVGDADRVLEKMLYSYQRGAVSLLELLIAQRKATEVHLGFLDALSERTRALVEVERASGAFGLLEL